MEPEREIEKWLRAFAKKRRDQAGAGMELHPATRRLLQGEVWRRFGSPERKPVPFLKYFRWISFRPVEVLVVVTIIALLAAMLLPTLSRSKMKSQSVSVMGNLKQIGRAAILYAGDNDNRLPLSYGAMTNYLPGDEPTIDPVSGERFTYVGGGQQLNDLKPTESVLAYSPTDKKGRAVLFADGHVELANSKRFAELTNRGLVQLALADVPARRRLAETPAAPPPPAAAPVASAPPSITVASGSSKPDLDKEQSKGASLGIELAGAGGYEIHKLEGGRAADKAGESPAVFGAQTVGFVTAQTNFLQWAAGNPQRFARIDRVSGKQYGLKSDDVSGKIVPVLATFQVQQNGSSLQVVDGDGSVYRGYVQTGGATFQTGAAFAGVKPTTNERQSLLPPLHGFGGTSTSAATVPQSREKDVRAGKGAELAAPNYFFRVTGTNLSLKQSVVFTGSFLAQNVTFGGGALAVTNGAPFGLSGAIGGGGGSGGAQNAPTGQTPLLNGRISGTAVIGGTNQMEINAVPAAP